MNVDLTLEAINLDDPKNRLQYQFYKVSLALQDLATQIIPTLTETIQKFTVSIKPCLKAIRKRQRVATLKTSPEVWMASVGYKKLAHLARCSKKKRVRVKNLKRLYKLGLHIEKAR